LKVLSHSWDSPASHGADRKLALRITAILTTLAIAVIVAAVYAGIAMNSAREKFACRRGIAGTQCRGTALG